MFEVIRWVTIAIMWVCLAVNWWLIWRNYKNHRQWKKLIAETKENLAAVFELRCRYEDQLRLREENNNETDAH